MRATTSFLPVCLPASSSPASLGEGGRQPRPCGPETRPASLPAALTMSSTIDEMMLRR